MEIPVEWTPVALARLSEIYSYFVAEAGTATADRMAERLLGRTRILAHHPQAGQREELLRRIEGEFRYLVEGNYKVVYRFDGAKVWVVDLFDCRQNPRRWFQRFFGRMIR